MSARPPHRPTPKPASVEEGFLLLLAATLLTAPLCRLFRWVGERLRERCCDDDDDEVEVEHADEGECEGDEAAECEVDEEREGEEGEEGEEV